jgi:hypothetical protein
MNSGIHLPPRGLDPMDSGIHWEWLPASRSITSCSPRDSPGRCADQPPAWALLLRRMPPGLPGWPVVRPALLVCAAWLFLWPYQLPWYDTMVICLLVFYPASWLDGLVLIRLAAGTLSNIPGNPWPPASHLAATIEFQLVGRVAPLLLFAAAVGLVLLGLADHRRRPPPAFLDGASDDSGRADGGNGGGEAGGIQPPGR